MEYTIQNVSDDLDAAARQCAEHEGVSLNEVLLRALRRGFGVDTPSGAKKRDFASIFKGEPLEPEVIKALEEQRQIDWEMWSEPEPTDGRREESV